ncbi:MAG: thioredoxin family protein [Proteobacteria bacterium]|nr:thioredoxin family protein [Pseudomonadota bacterium]
MALPAVAQVPGAARHVQAELVADRTAIAPGETIHVALRQRIEPHWHTYWRNSGDSGEATRLKWDLPAGWQAGDFTWPAPKKLPVGPLMNYGYEGEVLLPMAMTAPASAKAGDKVALKAKASFLVCADICVPEEDELAIILPVGSGPSPADPKWGPAIAKVLAEAPKPGLLTAVFQPKSASAVALAITGAPLKGADVAGAYFFPFDATVIDHAKPQTIDRGPEGLTLTLPPGYAFQGGKSPAAMAGVLEAGGKAYEIAAAPGAAPAGAGGLGPPVEHVAAGGDRLGLAVAAGFAFLGGLILNLMPCVFPILAMKAASLAGHGGGDSAAEARAQGLAFGLGAVATFLGLAGLLIGLKAAGAAVGWGFQLQSPPVVAVLCLLMLAVALDMSGVFEVGASLQGAGSGLAAHGGKLGAFFTGLLAVVVAAPCTAPFMGSAIGWALTQSAVAALVVFLALGIGFAAPFVLVAFAPGLLARLPRPGAWMDIFRKALAFPMYGAAAWLAWVFAQQADAEGLAKLFAAAILVALGGWLLGLRQRRATRTGAFATVAEIVVFMLVVVSVTSIAWPQDKAAAAEVAAETYSPERLAALRAEGRPVFVNYTAAWCVSCQVNDKVAISTGAVRDAFARHKVAYLKADWTKRDGAIAAELAHYGRAGVPLYLVYGRNGGEGVILPSILTPDIVVKAVEAADKS